MKLVLVSTLFLLNHVIAYNPIIFDPFTDPVNLIASEGHEQVTRITRDSQIWQGERDLAIFASDVHNSTISCTIASGACSIQSLSANSSVVTLQYDGTDNSMKFNPTSTPQDFYQNHGKGFQTHFIVQNEATVFIMVYTNNGVCKYSFDVHYGTYKYYSDFRLFDINHEYKCNFSAVVGVELNIILTGKNICSLSFFGTYSDDYVLSELDKFDVPEYSYTTLSTDSVNPAYVSFPSSCCAGDIIGGQRDLYYMINSVTFSASYLKSNISNEIWSIETGYGVDIEAVLQYDGPDESCNLDSNGLGGLDFTDNGYRDSFLIQLSNNQTTEITIDAYVNKNGSTVFSTTVFTIFPNESITSQILPFSAFSPSIPFSSVGSVEIKFKLCEIDAISIYDLSLINAAEFEYHFNN